MNSKQIRKIGENMFLFNNGCPVLKLNETSAFIIERALKDLSEEQIAMELSKEYDVTLDEVLPDVSNFISVYKEYIW